MSRGWYGDYHRYYPPSRPIEVEDGLKTKKKSGDIGQTWWSKRWLSVLESFSMGARLDRGRSYARRGQTRSLEITPGVVTAKVQGSRPKPYDVKIKLKALSEVEWDKVISEMASQAIYAARLLTGEMPQNIEDAFQAVKVPLFPASKKELITDCSCPDWANPCKHIAAVYYLMADAFDEDPFLLFRLRGRTKEKIMTALRKIRVEKHPMAGSSSEIEPLSPTEVLVPPLEKCLKNFWRAGEDLASFTINIENAGIAGGVLKRLGEAPFAVGGRNLIVELEPFYEAVAAAAREKVGATHASPLPRVGTRKENSR
ncbi:MAG: SWIM zinc finger family protein [bacterium]